jgi:hypothetical protein
MKNIIYSIASTVLYSFMLFLILFASKVSDGISFTYAAF